MKLFLLYLFAALIAAANSLDCVCTNSTKGCPSGTCTVDSKGGSCIVATWNYTKKDSKAITKNFRGCENSKTGFDACEKGDFVFTAGENFTWDSVCCNKTKCNNFTPLVNTTHTRKVCSTCFVFSSKPCNGTKKNCIVSQNYCLTISGDYKEDPNGKSQAFFGRGCATSSAKILGNGTEMAFGNLSISIKTVHMEKAKDGASRVPGSIAFTVLLPYLLGLLLDKFFY